MNELAVELNEILESSVAYPFLSERGKRLFFPKGIVAQSAEAGEKANRYNATVGLATDNGQPFCLNDIYSKFVPGSFSKKDIFSYAPGGGDKKLRALWKSEIERKNPTLKGKLFSEPLVTAGLTHTISLIAAMFVNEGDEIVSPDLFWDNYELIFSDSAGGVMKTFKSFDENGRINIEGMKEALLSCKGDCARIILNFPNNPTGYTPSKDEAKDIVSALVSVAETGKKIMVISDDAYFGLFYEDETEKESLFSFLADAHENIFAIKGDAATKEEMVWGFRIGFISYASKNFTAAHLDALGKKTLGAIRCTVSNCDRPGQSLLLQAMTNGKSYESDKKYLFDKISERYNELKSVLSEHEGSTVLKPYPFNSGYFMAFSTCGHDAEELRRYLLDKYGVGAINIMGKTLRLAYCSVEKEGIKELVDLVYNAAEELWS